MRLSTSNRGGERIVKAIKGWLVVALASAALGTAITASAGNFGIRHRAMAGTGVALHLGAESVSINPAAAAYLGNCRDLAWTLSAVENRYGANGSGSLAADDLLLVAPGQTSDSPRLASLGGAASWVLDEDEQFHLSVTLSADEVLRTNFDQSVYVAPGTVALGADTGLTLRQYVLTPTVSMLLGERHALGIAPILALQSFEAKGLSALSSAGLSSDPAHVSDNGSAFAPGFGAQIGYLGEWLDFLSVGISYRSPIWMSSMDDYSGLIAEQGALDAPASVSAGIALGFSAMGVAVDYQRIFGRDVAALGNSLLPNARTADLGEENGAGLGWDDVDLVKVGAWYTLNSGLVFRAGFAHRSQPAGAESVTANVIAPVLSPSQLSFGVTKPITFSRQLTIQVTRHLPGDLTGRNGLDSTGQQVIDVHQEGWELGMGLSF